MDQELVKKIDELAQKVDDVQKTVAQLRTYFLWAMIISIAVIVLPMIGLVFVVPQFLDTYKNIYTPGF